MALKPIETLEDVAKLESGRVGAAFKLEMQRIVDDLDARASVETARKLLVEVELKPESTEEGTLAAIGISVSLKTKLPARKTRETACRLTNDGKLQFNDFSPDDHSQMTIDQVDKGE